MCRRKSRLPDQRQRGKLKHRFHLQGLDRAIQRALGRIAFLLQLGNLATQGLRPIFLFIEFADVTLDQSLSPRCP